MVIVTQRRITTTYSFTTALGYENLYNIEIYKDCCSVNVFTNVLNDNALTFSWKTITDEDIILQLPDYCLRMILHMTLFVM